MIGLESLPLERRQYYKRLHDRLVEINFKAVNNNDWQTVHSAAKMHIDLQHLLTLEVNSWPRNGPSRALEIALSIIEQFCRFSGWC